MLKEPSPVALFDNFGDSSLNLKLMCFLPNLENRWQTIHAINSTIDRKFKAAGIEIPFPQRDVNFRLPSEAISLDIAGASAMLRPKSAALRPGAKPAEGDRQGAA